MPLIEQLRAFPRRLLSVFRWAGGDWRRDDHLELGRRGEDAACAFLRARGYRIVRRNYRVESGEIDLIAGLGDQVVFVEVKTRRSEGFGGPEGAVNHWKRRRIKASARRFLGDYEKGPRRLSPRFDIVAVEYLPENRKPIIRHIPDAFR